MRVVKCCNREKYVKVNSSKYSTWNKTGQAPQEGGHNRESPGCRYRGLVWDGAERGAELGGWDGVTND